jgi:hypothetical protein
MGQATEQRSLPAAGDEWLKRPVGLFVSSREQHLLLGE